MTINKARPLPTRANKAQNNNDMHNCCKPNESPSLPDFDIEIYWKKECQWWYIDRKTIIHELHHTSEDSGSCIASWGVRKRVRCKWRRLCEENDDEAPSSDEEDYESSSEQQTVTTADSIVKEGSSSFDPNVDHDSDDDMSVTHQKDLNNNKEEEEEEDEEDDDDDANWWDYSSDESDDSSDEDYNSAIATKKRMKRILPCHVDAASFGADNNTIVKGGIYEHINKEGEGKWIVKVIEFVGKKLPIRKARCQIIFQMNDAIKECFLKKADSPCSDDEAASIDRTIVMEEIIKGTEFLSTLVMSEENFDKLSESVEYDLKRDRSNKLIAQFTRRKRERPPSSVLPATGDAALAPATVQDNQNAIKTKPRELVLFAGIGGCSIGDEQAGFDCKWLVDKDHLAAASLRQCHPHATIYDEDVGAFLDKCSKQQAGYPKRGDVDHIQCSSPCNGFSRMNIYGGRHDHMNNILCHELVRAVETFLPKTGLFENVTGLLDSSNVHHVIRIVQDLIRLKYQVRVAVLNSADFGVPQKRKRVIITLARRNISMPCLPTPSNGTDSHVTVGDAIQDLLDTECEMERHRSGLVQLPNGNLTFNHVARIARKDSKTLDINKPVTCITTQNSFKHPLASINRTLSIREYARLFGFPDSVQFFGSYTVIRKQIGNSVPVPLARAISIPIRCVHEDTSTMRSEPAEM